MIVKSLLKDWKLLEQALYVGPDCAAKVERTAEGWMDIPAVPCDVHTALERAGKIENPYVAENTVACEWVEKRSWWFKKTFTLTAEELQCFGAELMIETLDIHADLFLNGTHLGHHASAFYPFCKDVLPWLKAGENTLLIRLTTGLENVTDEEVDPVRDFVACEFRSRRAGRGDDRRTGQRKPQYVFGWDQSPRMGTCCIAGDVCLKLMEEVVVRDVHVETLALTDAGASLLAEAEIENREPSYTRIVNATFTLEKDGKVVYEETKEIIGQAGVNYVDFSFTLPKPELWWPNGYGAQPLYTARVKAEMYGSHDEKSVTTGIRTVKLDMASYKPGYRRYAFIVNGKRIYCKGMDYIQTRHIYAEVTETQQDRLLTFAKNAGFNMIRFWDGNRYHENYVYELCDKYGLMVYQNFCFACGAYPDHLESFCNLVEKEASYQMKRLRSHPCIALWVGNGESSGLLHTYLGMDYFKKNYPGVYPGGTKIYGEILPRLHRALIASVGYQVCSPMSDDTEQESPRRGDMHFYPFLNIAPSNQQNRISVQSFDVLDARFITESGVMAPPSAETLARVCGGREHFDADDKVFEHHRNTFERYAVRDGIYKHYTGERKLSLEEYCLYGGLFQGTLLSYASDHVRLMEEVGGSLFWCMNDGFGEVGFSIIDFDLNPKPAYYYLKRAYAANRVILRREGGEIAVYCGNDAPEAKKLRLRCGYVSFDGKYGPDAVLEAELPANAGETRIGTFAADGDDHAGAFYAMPETEGMLPAVLWADDFKKLNVPQRANLTVSDVVRDGEKVTFTVTTDVFAHAVHFGLGADRIFSDLYFDLLPGESRRITLENGGDVTGLRPQCVFLG